MTAIQYFQTSSQVTTPAMYTASQQLTDILLKYRFVEISKPEQKLKPFKGIYSKGFNYFFRNNGMCTVNFLKDGRVHVLYGPISYWNLHDFLTSDELMILIAFSKLTEEHQELMRNYMTPRCKKYLDVLSNIPKFSVDWKNEFLKAFAMVNL